MISTVASLVGDAAPHDPATDEDVPTGFTQIRDEVRLPRVTIPGQKVVPQRISLVENMNRPLGLISLQALDPEDNADPEIFLRTYQVTSRVWEVSPLRGGDALVNFAELKGGDPHWSPAVREHYLAMPDDPRYENLAHEILADFEEMKLKPRFRGSPVLRAWFVMRWMEKNRKHTNTPAPSPDPTAAFLFDGKVGKCVQVANAMALLLRSVGIPARTARGFVAPVARKQKGPDLLLLESDAHRWCEIYLDGAGWFIIDPSLKSIDPPRPAPDPVLTKLVTRNHHREELKIVERLRAEESGSTGKWLAVFILTWLAILYGIKVWRLLAPRIVPEAWLHRVCYRAALDRLAEVGLFRRFGETRAEFAQRIASLTPDFTTLSAAHERRSFGAGGDTGRQRWLEMQVRVTGCIDRAFPRPRRLVGALNPVSWLSVR